MDKKLPSKASESTIPRWLTKVAALAEIVGTPSGNILMDQPEAPTPEFPSPKGRDDAWCQDVAYLREEFPKIDRSFTTETLQEFDSILSLVHEQISVLSDNEIVVRITRAVAASGNAHTRTLLLRHGNHLSRIPIRFYWFSDGLYVVKATRKFATTLGARVVAINGNALENLMGQVRDFIPGSDSWVLYKSSYFLNSPEFLHGMGVVFDPDSVPITFQNDDGMEFTRNLPSLPIQQRDSSYEAWTDLSPLSTRNRDGNGWLHILSDRALPLYLKTPNVACSYKMVGSSLLYIQINRNISDAICSQSDFANEIKLFAQSHSVRAVVFDVRFNGGGNYLETLEITKGISAWFKSANNIYIINGPATFSAGIVSTARLKYFSEKRALIVGEPAGDELRMWAEGPTFTLPNSGMRVKAAIAFHDWAEDSFEFGKTYFPNLFHGVAAGDIDVDIPVATSFQYYLSGRDPVMEAISSLEG